MSKFVHVAGTASVEPQEVPGFPGTFPQPLKGSGQTEKEWLHHTTGDGDEKTSLFEIRDVRDSVPAKDEGTALEAAAEGSES